MAISTITPEHNVLIAEAVDMAPRAGRATQFSPEYITVVDSAARLATYLTLDAPNYPNYPMQDLIDGLNDPREQAHVIAGVGDTNRQDIEGFVALESMNRAWQEIASGHRHANQGGGFGLADRYLQTVDLFSRFPGSSFLEHAAKVEAQKISPVIIDPRHITTLAVNAHRDGTSSAMDWLEQQKIGLDHLSTAHLLHLFELTDDTKFLVKAAEGCSMSARVLGDIDVEKNSNPTNQRMYHSLVGAGLDEVAEEFMHRVARVYRSQFGDDVAARLCDAMLVPVPTKVEPEIIGVAKALDIKNPVEQVKQIEASYLQIVAPVITQQRALPVTRLPIILGSEDHAGATTKATTRRWFSLRSK